jgi:hypothetical protein
MKFIEQNIKPIAFVTLCGCIGYLLGSATVGAVIGLGSVALVTLFLDD